MRKRKIRLSQSCEKYKPKPYLCNFRKVPRLVKMSFWKPRHRERWHQTSSDDVKKMKRRRQPTTRFQL